jgi:hypothetical protein
MITDMAHGTPLSRAEGGFPGPYMIDAGISSSDHIAKFFGLTDVPSKAAAQPTKSLRPVSLFGALRKATRFPRIRAWCEAGDNVAKI